MSDYGYVRQMIAWPEYCEQPVFYTSIFKYAVDNDGEQTTYREEQTGAVVTDVEKFERWVRKHMSNAREDGRREADPLSRLVYRKSDPYR